MADPMMSRTKALCLEAIAELHKTGEEIHKYVEARIGNDSLFGPTHTYAALSYLEREGQIAHRDTTLIDNDGVVDSERIFSVA